MIDALGNVMEALAGKKDDTAYQLTSLTQTIDGEILASGGEGARSVMIKSCCPIHRRQWCLQRALHFSGWFGRTCLSQRSVG